MNNNKKKLVTSVFICILSMVLLMSVNLFTSVQVSLIDILIIPGVFAGAIMGVVLSHLLGKVQSKK